MDFMYNCVIFEPVYAILVLIVAHAQNLHSLSACTLVCVFNSRALEPCLGLHLLSVLYKGDDSVLDKSLFLDSCMEYVICISVWSCLCCF